MREESKDNLATTVALKVVCKHYGIEPKVLRSKSQKMSAVLSRQVTYYILRDCFHHSYPEIGEMMGRDHSTVMVAHRRLLAKADSNDVLRAELNSLSRNARRMFNSQTLGDVNGVPFSTNVMKQLEELLDTGMYGTDLGDVVERLVCQQLQGLKVSK